MSDEELAWCAGFLDGEGSFLALPAYPRKGRPGKTPPRLQISATQKDDRVLLRLQSSLGGKVYRYDRGVKGVQCQWTTTKKGDFEVIVAMIWPWMSPVKKEQVREAVIKFEEFNRRHRNDS